MAKILIVGAGQAGLQLGHGLLQHGYDVTIVSDRTPADWRDAHVSSSQFQFATSLSYERELGLDWWDPAVPKVEGLGVTIPNPEGGDAPAVEWFGHLDSPGHSIDQRVKFPSWMEKFELRGGKLVIHAATPEDLDRYTAENDLVIVATGKGQLGQIFERWDERCTYDEPQRALALTYCHGVEPRGPFSSVCFNLIPGVGEYFVFEGLTLNGPCWIMTLEGIPGGPMDCWDDVRGDPKGHWEKTLWILETFLPWEYVRVRNAELTDAKGILSGRFAPTVRKPVATTASGRKVLGLADAVLLNDPITGQGANNATKGAKMYLDAILERGEGPFDEAWMNATFERVWDRLQPVATWTNALLAPPPEHVINLLGAAGQYQEIADRFANGFDDPSDFFNWFMDPQLADQYLQEVASRA